MAVYGNRSLGPQVVNVLIALFLFVFCLFVCLLVFCLLVVFCFCFCFFLFPVGKIKCVAFCRVTQTKQACKLSVRNYRFEILQRIQKRRLIGENCFEVQIRQNHFISEGS